MGCYTVFVAAGDYESLYKKTCAVVLKEIDPKATILVCDDSFGKSGRIGFSFKERQRSLFFCEHIFDKDSSDSFTNRMLRRKNGIYMALGMDEEAIEFFKRIGPFIGGFCKENDCDDDGVGEFAIHPSNSRGFPEVRAFTQQELLELVQTLYPNDIVILKT